MSIYRVELSSTFSDTYFDFTDYGEAMGFVGIALENGSTKGCKLTATMSILEQEVENNE